MSADDVKSVKSLGEKVMDAVVTVSGEYHVWANLSDDLKTRFERTGIAICASLSHDETATAVIADLNAKLSQLTEENERLRGAEHRVCDGCGTSWTAEALKTNGKVSCCPERKMLTAKEWSDRATKAEAERDEALEALKPFAAVSTKAKGADDACWCGQDGAVIRYRDLRRAALLARSAQGGEHG